MLMFIVVFLVTCLAQLVLALGRMGALPCLVLLLFAATRNVSVCDDLDIASLLAMAKSNYRDALQFSMCFHRPRMAAI